MVNMSHMVDSLRKHQKMIILGVALGVIALYIIPIDQVVNALSGHSTGLINAQARLQATRDRLKIVLANHPDVLAKIDAHLLSVINHLKDVQYKIEHL